jgi:hypothetical protein
MERVIETEVGLDLSVMRRAWPKYPLRSPMRKMYSLSIRLYVAMTLLVVTVIAEPSWMDLVFRRLQG